jgi:arylsulfatase A-like enzyme
MMVFTPFVTKAAILLIRRFSKKKQVPTPPGIAVLVAAGIVAGAIIALFVKADMAVLPAVLLFGIGLGLHRSTGRILSRLFADNVRVLAAAVVAALCPLLLLLVLNFLPDASKLVLLTRSPYTGSFLGLAHNFFDSDKDGYASILLGGDCDDSNRNINPGASDKPGDGIDQDCSGADALLYHPPKKPSFKRPAELGNRMNVILILLDALRPDHVHFAGYSRKVTKNIDKFRKRATWFKRAYTPIPVTQSAMLSLFTGSDFRRMPRKYVGYKRFTVLPKVTTIAERLKTEGYDTRGYTISYVILSAKGLGQGFDMWKTPWPVKQWADARRRGASLTTDASIKQFQDIPDDGSRPYLFFVHYYSTHAPYYKHDKWDFGDTPVDKYDSALAYNDKELGRLLDYLDTRKDMDNTAVILFSDHGEMLGDHGLTEHGRSLFESEIATLLLARIPGAKKKTVDSPVLLTDIAPTVLDLAGIEKRNDNSTGFSLIPYIFNNYKNEKRPLFLFTECQVGSIKYNAGALIEWPFKYIRDKRVKSEYLFNMEQDQGEENNLVNEQKETADSMSSLLESFEAFANGK